MYTATQSACFLVAHAEEYSTSLHGNTDQQLRTIWISGVGMGGGGGGMAPQTLLKGGA